MLASELDELAGRIRRQTLREFFRELADRGVNESAAFGGAGRGIDRVQGRSRRIYLA